MAFGDYITMDINYLAVFIAAVAYFLLGWLWYSDYVFGKEVMKNLPSQQYSGGRLAGNLVAEFILDLIIAYVLAIFISIVNISTWGQGMLVGLWAWIGFVGAPMLSAVVWSHKPFTHFLINAGFVLVGLLLMGGIIGYLNFNL